MPTIKTRQQAKGGVIPDSRAEAELKGPALAKTQGSITTSAPAEAFGTGVSRGTSTAGAIADVTNAGLKTFLDIQAEDQRRSDEIRLAKTDAAFSEFALAETEILTGLSGQGVEGYTEAAKLRFDEKVAEIRETIPDRALELFDAKVISKRNAFLSRSALQEDKILDGVRLKAFGEARDAAVMEFSSHEPLPDGTYAGNADVLFEKQVRETAYHEFIQQNQGAVLDAQDRKIIQQNGDKAIGHAYAAQAKRLYADGDIQGGLALLERHKGMIGDNYYQIHKGMRIAGETETVATLALRNTDLQTLRADPDYTNSSPGVRLAAEKEVVAGIGREARANPAAEGPDITAENWAFAAKLRADHGAPDEKKVREMGENLGLDEVRILDITSKWVDAYDVFEAASGRQASESWEDWNIEESFANPEGDYKKEISFLTNKIRNAPLEVQEELLPKLAILEKAQGDIAYGEDLTKAYDYAISLTGSQRDAYIRTLRGQTKKDVIDLLKDQEDSTADTYQSANKKQENRNVSIGKFLEGEVLTPEENGSLSPEQHMALRNLNSRELGLLPGQTLNAERANEQERWLRETPVQVLAGMSPSQFYAATDHLVGRDGAFANEKYKNATAGYGRRKNKFDVVDTGMITESVKNKLNANKIFEGSDLYEKLFPSMINNVRASIPDKGGLPLTQEFVDNITSNVYAGVLTYDRGLFSKERSAFGGGVPSNVKFGDLEPDDQFPPSLDMINFVNDDIVKRGGGYEPEADTRERLYFLRQVLSSQGMNASVYNQAESEYDFILEEIEAGRSRTER